MGGSLTVVTKHRPNLETPTTTDSPHVTVTSQISDLVLSHVPEAEFFSEAGSELMYRLPLSCARVFPALLRDLDSKGPSIGVDSFGISMTTLEEVFLKIARDEHLLGADKGRGSDGDGSTPIVVPHDVDRPSVQGAATAKEVTFDAANPSAHVDLGISTTTTDQSVQMGSTSSPLPLLPERAGRRHPLASSCPSPLRLLRRAQAVIQAHFPPIPVRRYGTRATMGLLSTLTSTSHAIEMALTRSKAASTQPAPPEAPKTSRDSTSQPREWTFLWEQFRQLIWKRFLVAKRDLKGFVFSNLLPVVLILMILLILSVNTSVDSPSIPMNLDLYARTEVFYTTPNFTATPNTTSLTSLEILTPAIEDPADKWTRSYEGDSYNLSSYLLSTYRSHGSTERMGAYVFDDAIPVNLTVDWPLVKSEASTYAYLAAAGSDRVTERGDLIIYRGPVSRQVSLPLQQSPASTIARIVQSNNTFILGALAASNITGG